MDISYIRQNATQFVSITSVTVEKFDALVPLFEQAWKTYINAFTLDGLPRVRPYVPSKNEFLPLIEEKLFFILAYEKNAILQEFYAASFGTNQAIANKWVHLLAPILAQALADYAPKRRIEEVDFAESDIYLVDATERGVQRDTYHQEDYFSGKKKRHTVKNMAICSLLGALVFLSPTVFGRIADKTLIETCRFTHQKITFYADLAFLAWNPSEHIQVILPHKKPKDTKTEKRALSREQKAFNRQHAQIRVKIEHVFAHLKTMRILKDTIRNYKEGFKDLVMLSAASLYNFRKGYKLVNSTF